MSQPSLTHQLLLDNAYFLSKDQQASPSHYLYLSFQAATAPQNKDRLPLNLSLVLDRSGSMSSEDKLGFVKQAASFVARNLLPTDHLSVVQYDSEVQTLFPQTALQSSQNLLKRIQSIQPGGMTNLSGGMLEGYRQVSQTETRQNMVNRVLLLSDGLANQGITDPAKLKEIARRRAAEERVSLSTFGVGSHFSEELMMQLAEYGNGTYYFIGSPDDIPTIFAAELKDLLAVVAQNLTVELHYPATQVAFVQAEGLPHQHQPGQLTFSLGDIFSAEEKASLMQFRRLAEAPVGPVSFRLVYRFQDVLDLPVSRESESSILLQPTEDATLYARSQQPRVLEQVAVFEANRRYARGVKLAQRRRFAEARELVTDLLSYLDHQRKVFPESAELEALYPQVKQLMEELKTMESWDAEAMEMSHKHHSASAYYARSKKAESKSGMRRMQYMKEMERGSRNKEE
ncbi:MAG: VWA domain-containing protein [Bacteroidetes bacterium]|nr:MAG: VWA domain-containing protein [Bacteroidota bacterium]